MADAWVWTFVAVLAVSAVSLVGAVALTLPALRSHRFLLLLVAVAAGTLVGDALLHLLPEAVEAWDGDLGLVGPLALLGFGLMFGLELVLRGRHSHVEDIAPEAHGPDHPDHHGHGIAPYAVTNLVGDGLHNLLDGAAIAAAFLVDTAAGVATTIAVLVHEVPQELADFGVLVRGGMTPRRALGFNLLSALAAVVGALAILALPVDAESLQRVGFPLIMGAFLYVGAADLIPELHHHSRSRDAWLIGLAVLAGVGIMFGILGLESAGVLGGAEHGHDHG